MKQRLLPEFLVKPESKKRRSSFGPQLEHSILSLSAPPHARGRILVSKSPSHGTKRILLPTLPTPATASHSPTRGPLECVGVPTIWFHGPFLLVRLQIQTCSPPTLGVACISRPMVVLYLPSPAPTDGSCTKKCWRCS